LNTDTNFNFIEWLGASLALRALLIPAGLVYLVM